MTKRNPYRVIERAARMVGNALVIAFGCLSVAAVLFLLGALLWDAGWGWWSLTIIVIAPAGLVVIGLFVALYWWLVGVIDNKWRQAKFRWDDSRTQPGQSQGSGEVG